MLTKYLLQKDCQLLVVEADRDMILYLQKYYPDLNGNIIAGNFLRIPLDQLFEGQSFAIIGNFPYNISSQILFHMLDHRQQVPELVGMFQKEMAERVIAQPGSKIYGVISVLVQAYYEGKYLFHVERGSFTPPPRVTSGVIRLRRRAQPLISGDNRLFRQVVKLSFGQRRKMLRNTLKSLVTDEEMLQEDLFRQRPEQLSVEDFVALTTRIQHRMENP